MIETFDSERIKEFRFTVSSPKADTVIKAVAALTTDFSQVFREAANDPINVEEKTGHTGAKYYSATLHFANATLENPSQLTDLIVKISDHCNKCPNLPGFMSTWDHERTDRTNGIRAHKIAFV